MKNFFAVAFLLSMLLPAPALATFHTTSQGSGAPASQGTGAPYSQGSSGAFELQNPLKFSSICGFMKGVFNALITIGIPIAVLFIAYAGFQFVWARGSKTGLQKAKDNAMYVVFGLGLFLGAWFLSQIIASTIQALGGPNIATCS